MRLPFSAGFSKRFASWRDCMAMASRGDSAGARSPARGEGRSVKKGALGGRSDLERSSLVRLRLLGRRLAAIVKGYCSIFFPCSVGMLLWSNRCGCIVVVFHDRRWYQMFVSATVNLVMNVSQLSKSYQNRSAIEASGRRSVNNVYTEWNGTDGRNTRSSACRYTFKRACACFNLRSEKGGPAPLDF